MTTICYVPSQGHATGRLLGEIEAVVPARELHYCRSLEELTGLDKYLRLTEAVFVLLIANREALTEVVKLKHTLRRHDIVLVLPDSQPQTLLLGHALYPRFLTYLDGDPSHVTMFLSNMADRRREGIDELHVTQGATGLAAPSLQRKHSNLCRLAGQERIKGDCA